MQSLFNRAELYKNCVRETSAVCDEGERKGGKQIGFARKKRLLHRLIISYKQQTKQVSLFLNIL